MAVDPDPADATIAGHVAGALLLESRTELSALRAGESDPGGWWGAPRAGSRLSRILAGDSDVDPEQETRRALSALAAAGLVTVDSVEVTRVDAEEYRIRVAGAEVTL